LGWLAKACERKCKEIFRGQPVEQCLPFAVMHKTRRGHSDINEIARFVSSIQVDDAQRFLERQTAQKQIVD
jgi:hypothetical protein